MSVTGTYQGRRLDNGCCEILVDGKRLSLKQSLRVANHSPTGFEWGYSGSGPAQTALAILLDFTGKRNFSERFHQYFKDFFVAGAPEKGWIITGERVGQFVKMCQEKEAALDRPLCDLCLCARQMHDPGSKRCWEKGCKCGIKSRGNGS